ncbi:MAG: hypothetical protein IPP29_19100 [Bacteroidetes bacterium]|nr:hypothetical protein [Bacteroidota bacterium]
MIKGFQTTSLNVDMQNNIWVTTRSSQQNKIIKYDGSIWTLEDSSGTNYDFAENGIIIIGTDFYAIGGVEIYKQVGANWVKKWDLLNNTSNGFHINFVLGADKYNNIWFSYREQSVDIYHIVKLNGQTFTDYSPGANTFRNDYYNTAACFDSTGTFWLGGIGALTSLKNNQWKIRQYGLSIGTQISDIIPNFKGNLIVASKSENYTGSLSKYDGKDWDIITRLNSGLQADVISSVAVDKNDNLYLATQDHEFIGRNLYKYNGVTFDTINTINNGVFKKLKLIHTIIFGVTMLKMFTNMMALIGLFLIQVLLDYSVSHIP